MTHLFGVPPFASIETGSGHGYQTPLIGFPDLRNRSLSVRSSSSSNPPARSGAIRKSQIEVASLASNTRMERNIRLYRQCGSSEPASALRFRPRSVTPADGSQRLQNARAVHQRDGHPSASKTATGSR
jgi:hypothetical protein